MNLGHSKIIAFMTLNFFGSYQSLLEHHYKFSVLHMNIYFYSIFVLSEILILPQNYVLLELVYISMIKTINLSSNNELFNIVFRAMV